MSKNPLGNPRSRWLDADGNPLSGGLLYSYEAGTTTPLDTYTTREGDVANSNPVELDANGEASVWLNPGDLYKFVLKDSDGVTQWTEDNYPSPAEASADTDIAATEPGGRLTLTSLTPVTTGDVTGATTIRYAPYRHNKVPLYDGSAWSLRTIDTELTQTTTDATKSPAAVTTNKNYDLFIWDDSGTLRLSRGPVWTSDTARGTGAGTTELERVNGRLVNKVSITNGPGAQRGLYVGTVRSDGSSQINDSAAKRHVWNAYNRVERSLRVTDATASWSYSSGSFQQANASAANQVDMVRGLDEDVVRASVAGRVSNSSSTARVAAVAVGLDSTTAEAAGCVFVPAVITDAVSAAHGVHASYAGLPGLGRHYLAWLERGAGADTQTWGGTSSGTAAVGIAGSTLA